MGALRLLCVALSMTQFSRPISAAEVNESPDVQWPYDLPHDAKYFPEHEFLLRRDMAAQRRLQTQQVVGVKKMSGDPGQKFYLNYWSFEGEDRCYNDLYQGNQSIPIPTFEHPYRLHEAQAKPARVLPRYLGLAGYSLFHKRAFQCPAGTSACNSINRPNSCCGSGTTCQLIQDTGLGDVGCCPDGQSCGGSLTTCPSGYSSCPNSPGGGCCIPGYACYEVGCVLSATATQIVVPTRTSTPIPLTTTETLTVVVTPTISSLQTVTRTVTTIRTLTPSTTILPTTVTTATTATDTIVPVPPPSTTTVTSTTRTTTTGSTSATCASGFRSCPASLGGGCCRTDRQCGSANCPASTSTGTLVPPGRPNSETTVTTTAEGTSRTLIAGCPTGFYACSAYYHGGCCQIGRDCGMTSCPTSASTTLIDGSSLTVIAPAGSGITSPPTLLTGSCAQGWSTCGADVGGGCCPNGYQCGTSCTATVSGASGQEVGKAAPEGGSVSAKRVNTLVMIAAIVFSVALAGELFI